MDTLPVHYISEQKQLICNVHMVCASHAYQFTRECAPQSVRDNGNRSMSIFKDTVEIGECTYTPVFFSINLQIDSRYST